METGGWSESESRRIRTYDSVREERNVIAEKPGCADGLIGAASALTDEEQEMTLEQFMEKVEQKNTKTVENGISIWIIWLF